MTYRITLYMKTVGQLLKSAREKHGLKLEDVEQHTRIRKRYLEALEQDKYDQLPAATYARGFIQNYASFLGLPATTLLAVFRRDFLENDRGQIIPRSITESPTKSTFLWTPRVTLATTIGFVIALFFGFLIYQYMGLLRPRLEIFTPQNGEVVLGPVVTVSGSTDPSAVLTVNERLVAVNSDGVYETLISLPDGPATILVEATNSRNSHTRIERQFTVRSAE